MSSRLPAPQKLRESMELVRQRVAACEDGFSEFIVATDYPPLFEALEACQRPLSALGLFELVWAALEQSEGLLQADRIQEAERVLGQAMEYLKDACND